MRSRIRYRRPIVGHLFISLASIAEPRKAPKSYVSTFKKAFDHRRY